MKLLKNKRLVWLLLLLFCISKPVCAQTDTVGKGFFKNWRVAGVSFTRCQLNNNNNGLIIGFFSNTATTDAGREKLTFDRNELEDYKRFQVFYPRSTLNTGSFEVVFKPRHIDSQKFINYIELFAGIDISAFNINMPLSGNNAGYGGFGNYFQTEYAARVNALNLKGGVTVQTPAVFQVVSLYAGAGVCLGATTFQTIATGASVFKGRVSASQPADTTIIYYQNHSNFRVGLLSGGVVFPLGIKFNVSVRSNLFAEFVLRSNSYTTHNTIHTQWFNGWGIGYRYKLLTKTEREERKKWLRQPRRNHFINFFVRKGHLPLHNFVVFLRDYGFVLIPAYTVPVDCIVVCV